jgi:regulator of sigma E protease
METITSTIIATVVVLGVLIFVHELGHFIVAKFFGVGVEVFSLGFGPKLLGRKYGETEYRLSLFPLGGYVKMVGESPKDEVKEEDISRSFSHKNVYRRFAIVFAGPFSNILFTVLVFFCIFLVSGLPYLTTDIGNVQEGSPAALAGIKKGDRILNVDGKPVEKWDSLSEAIKKSDGHSLRLQIDREGTLLEIVVAPKLSPVPNIFGEETKVPVIGITAAGKQAITRLNPFQAAGESVAQTWNIVRLTVLTVVKLIERKVSLNTVGGPIMIAQMAGQQAREGIMHLVFLMALISVNLAILNLLPIPVLDGGHLFFFLVEMTLGKPISLKKREFAQQVGLFILIMFMMFILYNDIARIVNQ